jgi:hypothetical protein
MLAQTRPHLARKPLIAPLSQNSVWWHSERRNIAPSNGLAARRSPIDRSCPLNGMVRPCSCPPGVMLGLLREVPRVSTQEKAMELHPFGAAVLGLHTVCRAFRRARLNRSIIPRLNAGKLGWRLVTQLPSCTNSRSTQLPPALRMSS